MLPTAQLEHNLTISGDCANFGQLPAVVDLTRSNGRWRTKMSNVFALSGPVAIPEDEQLEADLLAGWSDRRLNIGHREKSIRRDCAIVRAFRAFTQRPPWSWEARDMDAFGAAMRRAGRARETIRRNQNAVKHYLEFGTNPTYAWQTECQQRTGYTLRQICTPDNTLRHSHGAPSTKRRAFTAEELEELFQAGLDLIRDADKRPGKGGLTARRNFVVPHFTVAFGAREQETAWGDLSDLTPAFTPVIQSFSSLEGFQVRFGKSAPGGPPKQRFVPSIVLFRDSLRVLEWYLAEIRPLFTKDPRGPIFPSERGGVLRPDTIASIFIQCRKRAGLDPALCFHCLRHTFSSMLAQNGVEVSVRKVLLGHEDESTSELYTHVPSEYVRQRLLAHHERLVRESLTYAPR
jgi:hypothetical protein